jgi:hypothetical protein
MSDDMLGLSRIVSTIPLYGKPLTNEAVLYNTTPLKYARPVTGIFAEGKPGVVSNAAKSSRPVATCILNEVMSGGGTGGGLAGGGGVVTGGPDTKPEDEDPPQALREKMTPMNKAPPTRR